MKFLISCDISKNILSLSSIVKSKHVSRCAIVMMKKDDFVTGNDDDNTKVIPTRPFQYINIVLH